MYLSLRSRAGLYQGISKAESGSILRGGKAAVFEVRHDGGNGRDCRGESVVHQGVAATLQIVAGRNNLRGARAVPVLRVDSRHDDRQAKGGASTPDGVVDLKVGRTEEPGRAASGILDGLLALIDLVINLLVGPGEHMRVGVAVVLNAVTGILDGIESRQIAADPVTPNEEGGLGAGGFDIVDQRDGAARRAVIKRQVNRSGRFHTAAGCDQAGKQHHARYQSIVSHSNFVLGVGLMAVASAFTSPKRGVGFGWEGWGKRRDGRTGIKMIRFRANDEHA